MATKAPDYTVNYEDERFTNVEADKQDAMSELNKTYDGMINESDKYYQAQIDASKDWADKQSQLQQEQTDFTIEQIEQQKDQAQKDYVKEQSGAYVDWQKQSNEYGTEAEKKASAGMTATGYSESSQVSMYNTYQNRVATARESFSRAILNYDNSIKEARLQNNAILAEIAYEALQQQLTLSLEGFQYKNNLILDQANKKIELDNTYYNRYLNVLNQINTENAMKEEVRQFEETQKFQAEQADLDRKHQSAEAKLEREFKEAQAKLDRQHDKDMLTAKTEEEKKVIEYEYEQKKAYLEKELENEKALLKYQYELQQKSKSGSISGKSGGSSGRRTDYTNSSYTSGKVTKSSSSGTTVNTKSVTDLGRGPITSENLANLVAEGQVTATKKGNQIYVKNSNNKTAAAQSVLNKYTWLK